MTSYQNIKDQMELITKKSENIYMMSRDDIFGYLAELVATSQLISDFIRDIDHNISDVEESVYGQYADSSVAMVNRIIKRKTASLVADKDWANRQLTTIKDIRIATLAAQRSAE